MNGTAKAHVLGISMKNKHVKNPILHKDGQTLVCVAQRISGVFSCEDIQSP